LTRPEAIFLFEGEKFERFGILGQIFQTQTKDG